MVNNAGIFAFGFVEWTSMDVYQKVLEVNTWGAVRCTKAFLPLIRRYAVFFETYTRLWPSISLKVIKCLIRQSVKASISGKRPTLIV